MGLSNTMDSEITFDRGRVQQSNFHDYPFARINEAPRIINVHLIEQNFEVPMGGIGEPAVPPFMPALTNAIFARDRPADPGFADPQPDQGAARRPLSSVTSIFSLKHGSGST